MKIGDLVKLIPYKTWLMESSRNDCRHEIIGKIGIVVSEYDDINAKKLKAIPEYYGLCYKVLIEDKIYPLYPIELEVIKNEDR